MLLGPEVLVALAFPLHFPILFQLCLPQQCFGFVFRWTPLMEAEWLRLASRHTRAPNTRKRALLGVTL